MAVSRHWAGGRALLAGQGPAPGCHPGVLDPTPVLPLACDVWTLWGGHRRGSGSRGTALSSGAHKSKPQSWKSLSNDLLKPLRKSYTRESHHAPRHQGRRPASQGALVGRVAELACATGAHTQAPGTSAPGSDAPSEAPCTGAGAQMRPRHVKTENRVTVLNGARNQRLGHRHTGRREPREGTLAGDGRAPSARLRSMQAETAGLTEGRPERLASCSPADMRQSLSAADDLELANDTQPLLPNRRRENWQFPEEAARWSGKGPVWAGEG